MAMLNYQMVTILMIAIDVEKKWFEALVNTTMNGTTWKELSCVMIYLGPWDVRMHAYLWRVLPLNNPLRSTQKGKLQ